MAERVLKIKSVSEVAEAISGLNDLSGSLKGVGTAAFEAAGKSKGQWKELEAEWTKSSAAARGVSAQVLAVESALNAMGRASSASQLEAGLVKSKVALDALEGKLRAVAAAGGTIDDGVTSSLDVMRASIDAGKAKLDDLRSSTERARQELGLVGKAGTEAAAGIKQTGAAAGEAAGKTVMLGDQIRSTTERFNKFRGAALEMWGALQLGQQIGEGVSRAIEAVAERLERKAQAAERAAAADQAALIAMKAVRDGLIEEGRTIEETVLNYGKATVALGKLDEQSRKFIEGVAGLKVPDALPDLAKQGEAMELALRGAFTRGTEAGRRFVLENKAQLEQYRANVESTGRSVSEDFKAMVDGVLQAARAAQQVPAALDQVLPSIKTSAQSYNELAIKVLEMAKAQDVTLPQLRQIIESEIARKDATGETFDAYSRLIEVVDRLHESHKSIPEDIDREIARRKALQTEIDKFTKESNQRGQQREAWEAAEVNQVWEERVQQQKDFIAESTRVEEQMGRWIDVTQGAGKAFGALSGDFSAINAEVRRFVEAGGDVEKVGVSMQTIVLGVAAASREATQALLDQAVAQRTLNEAQAEALSMTQGWTDYILLLEESFKSGALSLQALTIQATEFRTQLQRLFGTVSGEARDALEGAIALLEQLLATAGATDRNTDFSYKGQLERQFSSKESKTSKSAGRFRGTRR